MPIVNWLYTCHVHALQLAVVTSSNGFWFMISQQWILCEQLSNILRERQNYTNSASGSPEPTIISTGRCIEEYSLFFSHPREALLQQLSSRLDTKQNTLPSTKELRLHACMCLSFRKCCLQFFMQNHCFEFAVSSEPMLIHTSYIYVQSTTISACEYPLRTLIVCLWACE
jgi:hypothetical protein